MTPTVQVHQTGDEVTVTFTVFDRPWTTNLERKGNRWDRSQKTTEWRQLFGWLTKAQRLPCLCNATVEVHLLQKGRMQDVAACNPAVKAAIDGLVDGGLLLDDDPENLHKIVFYAPQRAKFDQITLSITGKVRENDNSR